MVQSNLAVLLNDFQGFSYCNAAFIECSTNDHTGKGQFSQGFYVGLGGNATSGNYPDVRGPGELFGGLEIGADQHAVLADIGVNDSREGSAADLLGEFEGGLVGLVGPATDGKATIANVSREGSMERINLKLIRS